MTSVKYIPVPFEWKPFVVNGGWPNHALSCIIEKRIEKFLLKWEGTPYMSGQMMVGEGADCIRFMAAFANSMFGEDLGTPERLPQDASMHSRSGAIAGMRKILRMYPTLRPTRSKELQPGDILAVGPKDGGPSHILIVGVKPNTMWHAINECGVCWTGWSLMKDHMKVFRAYRFKDRRDWGRGWIS